MELFIDLGLKEISNIINRMGLTTGTNVSGEIEYNGVKYNYDKTGNTFVIVDSNGKMTRISIDYNEKEGKDAYNRDVKYVNHEVSIDYLLNNGESINLSNNIGLEPGYESFENVHRHDILDGLRTKYCDRNGKEIASFGLELNKICLKNNDQIYEFTKDGIACGKRLITLDGSTLVSVSGNETPSKETVESFNLKEEQAKVQKFIDESNDLHPFTKEALEDSIRKLDRRERYVKDIVDYYNTDIKDVRKAINIRNILLNSVKESIIDNKVLEEISDDFYEKTNNIRRRRF
jgi:hypothetical protein